MELVESLDLAATRCLVRITTVSDSEPPFPLQVTIIDLNRSLNCPAPGEGWPDIISRLLLIQ